ncbi:MAG TPA: EF-hand domain-containing protein [Sphingomicrobium sp.]|nr:EF-hand domain-containing protein [Sphingomicrobium sp.]
MALPVLIFLAAAAAPDNRPVVVTGHQWAPFISPMGEPFRARTATDDTLADWFYKADSNRDGILTAAEMQADAERFFATLDTNHDGQIDPDELSNYEYEIAPDIQVMSRTKRAPGQPAPVVKAESADDLPVEKPRRHGRGDQMDVGLGLGSDLQGAARYGLLNMPEPVAAADTDFNRAVTLDEFRAAAIARFQLLDKAQAGKLTLAPLEAMPHAPSTDKHHRRQGDEAPDERLGNPLPTGP